MAALAQTNSAAAPAAADALRDIKPPVEIPTGWEWLWWALGALALVALLVGLALFVFQRRKRVSLPPPIPPHVRAKQALDASLQWLAQPKPFVTAVSDTLRSYLEERFTFRAPERTTEEFLHELQATPLLDKPQKQSLGDFLQSCDMVKFAKYEPTEAELRSLHSAAYRLVEETEPRPEEPGAGSEKEDGQPPAQPSSLTPHGTK
jgi:hypothetical protein